MRSVHSNQFRPGSPPRRLFSYHRVSSMRTRRKHLVVAFAVVLVLAGAVLTAILLRKRAAPDAARLLPDSDAVFYINLEPIRVLTDLGKKPAKDRDPQYEEFVRQTGFEFERDLDKAAFAIHYGVAAKGKPAETRYSEIFQGHFDSARVGDYLRKLASSVERYRDFDIYIIPLEGRTVRVALLGIDIAAASNTDSEESDTDRPPFQRNDVDVEIAIALDAGRKFAKVVTYARTVKMPLEDLAVTGLRRLAFGGDTV